MRPAFAFATVLLMAPAAFGADARLTLEDAVHAALANNERAQKAPLRIDAAEGQLERARAAFLPTLVGSGTGQGKPTADRNARYLAGSGTLSLSQPLLNLPAFPLYAQARHQLESERWGATEDKRLLGFDTAHAFFLALSAERLLDAAQRRLERARDSQHDAEARADAQLASSNDVTRQVVATATAEGQVVQAQGNLERAYLQLSFLIRRPVPGPLAAPERTTTAAHAANIRLEDVLAAAETRRPDLRSSHERTLALQDSAKEPLYRLAPTLAVSGQVRTTIDPLPPDVAHDETALLTLTWTLYDAGVRYADRKTRLAQADSQALDEQQMRRSVATDIALAYSALRSARANYEVAAKGVEAAKKNVDETQILYKQGLARAIEVTDANAAQYDAEVTLETANLTMLQAYLGYRQAVGLEAVGDEPVPTPSDGAPR